MEQEELETDLSIADAESVSPESQEAYDMAVSTGLRILYNKGGVDRTLNALRANDGTSIYDRIAEMAKQMVVDIDARADLPEDVIVPAASELAGEILEIAGKARLAQNSDEQLEALISVLIAKLFDHYGVGEDDLNEVDPAFNNPGEVPPELVPAQETMGEQPQVVESEEAGLLAGEMGGVA